MFDVSFFPLAVDEYNIYTFSFNIYKISISIFKK